MAFIILIALAGLFLTKILTSHFHDHHMAWAELLAPAAGLIKSPDREIADPAHRRVFTGLL